VNSGDNTIDKNSKNYRKKMRKELLILEKTSDPKEYWKILIIYFLKNTSNFKTTLEFWKTKIFIHCNANPELPTTQCL
jgi:hypothetical protein